MMKLVGLFLLLTLSHAFAAGPIVGVEGPFITTQDGKLVVTLKMQEASHPSGLAFGITDERKSTVSYRPNTEDGGMLLELRLDIDELEAMGIGEGEANTLPDGRLIPGIPGGALKDSRRIERTNSFLTFHSRKSFGIAVPFNWNLGATRDGHHWLVWKGKNIGMISVVTAAGDKKAYGMIFLRYAAIRGNAELMGRINRSRRARF